MKRYLLVTIVTAAAVMGCDETVYKIEMEPRGDRLSRTLTVWRQGGEKSISQMDDDELAAIAKAYSREAPKGGDSKHKFTGAFAKTMPDDVGGSGRFIRYESNMGVASGYIERFRGNDRPGEVLEASLKAVDKITNILIGYLETELGKESQFSKLRKFMNTELRKDLKNLSVYSYLASNGSRLNWLKLKGDSHEILTHEVLARVASYAIERDYIEPGDVPLLKRSFTSRNEAQAGKLLSKVLKRIAAKAKITDAKFIARLASLLGDNEKVNTTFAAYLLTTPQYKELFKKQKTNTGDAEGADKNKSASELVLQPLLEKAVHIRLNIFNSTSRLDIQLAMKGEPTATNGKWNAKDRTITWKGSLTKRDSETTFLPEICYALWAKPDEKFQKARFGKVALSGKQLLDYCIWRQGLTANEAKLWDAVLIKHKPGQDIRAAVKAAAEPAKPMPYIEEGLRILQNAMKKREPPNDPEF